MDILIWTTVGFILVILDLLFIPGGFFVALGSCGILYGVFLNYHENGLAVALIHFFVCLASMPFLIKLSLKRLALKEEMHVEDGFVALDDQSSYVGLEAVVRSDLRPSGTIIVVVNDKEEYLDCISEGGMIEKGEKVKITEDRGTSLVVRRLSDLS